MTTQVQGGRATLDYSRVGVVNLEEDHLYEFDYHSDNEGEFRLCTGIPIDASERIYVAEER